jgi:hypothetical protein
MERVGQALSAGYARNRMSLRVLTVSPDTCAC